MSRREAWLSAAAVFAIALAIRIAAAAAVAFPVPEDTAYYAGVARNLAEGRGLISDALWSYQTQPLIVPRAAFEIWMPLPSLLEAIPVALAGAGNWFRAAQLVSVVASSLVAVMAWRVAADVAAEMRLPVGRARTMAVGSGLLAASLGPLVVFGALPDSTALFTALSLAACLLMTRLAAAETAPRNSPKTAPQAPPAATSAPSRRVDRRLIALGLLLGCAALTRSEAIWLALSWAGVAWFWTQGSRRRRLALIAIPAAVAIAVVVPWLVRDWLAFGTPLPGQSIGNAFFIRYTDVFAYQDSPSLGRFLGQGPATLAGVYGLGLAHDFLAVLAVPAFPVVPIALLALPWASRRRALRPLLLVSATTFVVTSLAFPVATLSGTYLHAAGSGLVLAVVCCVAALDQLVVRIGRIRHWTRPVAWLGPALALASAVPLCFVSVTEIAHQATDTSARYAALPAAMARAGVPLDDSAPVITDAPIWLAESAHVRTLALPDESPASVLNLADRFGAKLLVVGDEANRDWPGVLSRGGAAAECFREVPLSDASSAKPQKDSPLASIHVFRIGCP